MTQCRKHSSKESLWQQVAAGLLRLKFHIKSTRNKHFPATARTLPRGPEPPQEQSGRGSASVSEKACKIPPEKNKISRKKYP